MIYENWGVVPYQQATQKQLEKLEQVAAGKSANTLIFCSHPPLVTRGRATVASDIFGWTGDVYDSSRGGRATYHGPSQIIVYPIVNLSKSRDLHAYLRCLELAVSNVLSQHYSLPVSPGAHLNSTEGPSPTGVWVEKRKIASIGIAVKKWVSYHGLALNWQKDTSAFQGISPCGFGEEVMTSLESELGDLPDREDLERLLFDSLKEQLIPLIR